MKSFKQICEENKVGTYKHLSGIHRKVMSAWGEAMKIERRGGSKDETKPHIDNFRSHVKEMDRHYPGASRLMLDTRNESDRREAWSFIKDDFKKGQHTENN